MKLAMIERQRALTELEKHIPSINDNDESEMYDRMARSWDTENFDIADLAKRTCSCGEKIDGFYEFVDHLKEVFRG